MEDQVLGVTKLINALFGKPVLALLTALHIQPADPNYPIPNHIAMELVVFVIAIVFFTWLKGRLSVDNPGGTQQVMEMLLTNPMGVGARDLLEDTAGHHALQYLPMVGSIGIFVLLSNLINLVPGFSLRPRRRRFRSAARLSFFSITTGLAFCTTGRPNMRRRSWGRCWRCLPSWRWSKFSATSRECFP